MSLIHDFLALLTARKSRFIAKPIPLPFVRSLIKSEIELERIANNCADVYSSIEGMSLADKLRVINANVLSKILSGVDVYVAELHDLSVFAGVEGSVSAEGFSSRQAQAMTSHISSSVVVELIKAHAVGCQEYTNVIIEDGFESGEFDTDTWCEMICGAAYYKCSVGVTDENAFSGNYSLKAVHNTSWQSSSRCYLYAGGIGANYENVSCSAWIYIPSTPAVETQDYYDAFGFYLYDQSEKCGDFYGDHYLCKVSFVPDYYANSERISRIDIHLLGVGDLNTGESFDVDIPTDAWYRYVVRADTYDDKTVITACVLDESGEVIVGYVYVDTREERLARGNVGFMFEFMEGGRARYLLVDDIRVCKR